MGAPEEPLVLFDFSAAEAVYGWMPIDDRVMGGLSRSRLRHDPAGFAVFEGEISMERNGGFASVRSKAGPCGRAGARLCLVDVLGAARPYKLSLLTEDGYDSLHYQAVFTPEGRDWQTVALPIGTFQARFRGREVPGAPSLDPALIRQLGLTVSGKEPGPFALAVRKISLL